MAGFLKTVGVLPPFLTVIGWLLVPVITFVLNKLCAGLSVNLEHKLMELEIRTIPILKQKLMAVQKQRVLQAARNMGSDESGLQKLEEFIRSALYDADEVLDLVEYHRIEKKLAGDRSFWQQHLRGCWRLHRSPTARSGLDHPLQLLDRDAGRNWTIWTNSGEGSSPHAEHPRNQALIQRLPETLNKQALIYRLRVSPRNNRTTKKHVAPAPAQGCWRLHRQLQGVVCTIPCSCAIAMPAAVRSTAAPPTLDVGLPTQNN